MVAEDYLLLMKIHDLQKNDTEFRKIAVIMRERVNKIDIPLITSSFYETMGDYFLRIRNREKARSCFDSSLINLPKNDLPDRELKLLKKLLQTELEWQQTSHLISRWTRIDSLEKVVSTLRQIRITQETDARYSLRDKEEKIKILNEKNEASQALVEKEQELSEQNRKQILFLWIGIIAFIFFLIYVLLTNRKLKSTQKELQRNIEQKDFLFRELNHRVKNNLHIVSSFLSIESHGKSEDIKNILQTCENRIHSLGLVHEMLYKGEISENISVKSYFEKLITVLKETLLKSDTQIQTTIDDQLFLTSNKMVLVGLIANELITNSVKYAQSPDRRLVITIECHKKEDRFTLLIADNGIGLQDAASNRDSLGMKLAKGLTRQLNGEFSFENKKEGVEFRVEF